MRKLDERAVAVSLIAELQARGYIAVFAGGSVRDELMGRKPNDYDIATNALPDEVVAVLGRSILVGKSFGVVKVRRHGFEFDVATLRADGQYTDGRHPSAVRLGVSLFEDASRRDFAINAMFMDPISGEIFDFFGGREDIKRRYIRAVGNPHNRIKEDRLRMLRAPRFAARFGFGVDPDLMAAIKEHACEINLAVLDDEPKVIRSVSQWLAECEALYAPFPAQRKAEIVASHLAVLNGPCQPGFPERVPQPRRSVSFERINAELTGTLTSEFAVVGLDLLKVSGLLREVLPELTDVVDAELDLPWNDQRIWWQVREMVNRLEGSSFETLLAGLLWFVGAEKSAVILRRLKLTGDEQDRVLVLLRECPELDGVESMTRAQLVELLERPYAHELIALQNAVAEFARASGAGRVSRKQFLVRKHQELSEAPLESMRLGAKPVLTGRVLISMGFKPGPLFKQILEDALTAQREGVFCLLEEAKQWLTDRFGSPSAAGSESC